MCDNIYMQLNISEIPENNPPVKVIKMVHFEDDQQPQSIKKKQQISYDDILSKMGMFVKDGQLHLADTNVRTTDSRTTDSHNIQNSYIYNKHFKSEFKQDNADTIRRPKTMAEYKRMLIMDHIQRERIKQIKSRKIMIPNATNISYSTHDLNKLFNFSRR